MKMNVRKEIEKNEQLKSAQKALNDEIAEHKNNSVILRKDLGKCVKEHNAT